MAFSSYISSQGDLIHKETVRQLSTLNDLDWIRMAEYPGFVLELNSPEITDDEIAMLAKLENLEGLRLQTVSLAQLTPLTHLPILSDLAIRCAVDDDGLDWLCHQFPELRRLELSSEFAQQHELTNDGVKVLSTLKHLQRLSLIGTPQLGDNGLQSLLQMKLTHLAICYSQICCESITSLATSSPVCELSFYDCPVTDRGLASLANFLNIETLQTLAISIAKLTDSSFATVAGFRQLQELHLTGNVIEGAAWDELEKLQELQQLHLDSNPLRAKLWNQFPVLPQLIYINLDATPLDVESLLKLNRQPQLKRIEVGAVSFTDAQRFERESDIELDWYSV